ncbi:MAG: type II secretion system protein [Myxococcota bacterium]
MNQMKGFTLIELVLVIAILGILAVAAIPTFLTGSLNSARVASMNATVGAIQTGIAIFAATNMASYGTVSYPATLDSASNGAATPANRHFTSILQNGVSSQWIKGSATSYTFDMNADSTVTTGTDTCCTYTVATGLFTCATC